MRVLLDTQAWLWMLAAPERLAPATRKLLTKSANELLLSAASAWEIAIKHGLGKLRLPDTPERVVPELMVRTGVVPYRCSIATPSALRRCLPSIATRSIGCSLRRLRSRTCPFSPPIGAFGCTR